VSGVLCEKLRGGRVGYIEAECLKKKMAGIMGDMERLKKYVKFGKHNDFVILEDDFSLAQLEAIIFTMKGKAEWLKSQT
jgi:hypothetical protein